MVQAGLLWKKMPWTFMLSQWFVIDLLVEKCRFNNTDRGLRIKTRRGRGKDAVVDQITFRDIEMDQVFPT